MRPIAPSIRNMPPLNRNRGSGMKVMEQCSDGPC
jgi:hypothetical protein